MAESGDVSEQLGRKIEGLPYWDFSFLPEERQEQIFNQVYQRGLSQGRTLVLEIGPADTLTPVEAAAHMNNSLVLAVDIASRAEIASEGESRISKTDIQSLRGATEESGSTAAFFKLDGRDLGRYEFDRVQLVFPTPDEEDVAELVVGAAGLVKRGGELVIFYESTPGEVAAQDLVGVLKMTGFGRAKLEKMKPDQIKRDYGLTDSEFFDQNEIKVIKVRV